MWARMTPSMGAGEAETAEDSRSSRARSPRCGTISGDMRSRFTSDLPRKRWRTSANDAGSTSSMRDDHGGDGDARSCSAWGSSQLGSVK